MQAALSVASFAQPRPAAVRIGHDHLKVADLDRTPDGSLSMFTRPLDLAALLTEVARSG